MKYIYNRGIGEQESRKWLIIPGLILVVGLYAAFNVLAPAIFYALQPTDKTAQVLQTQQPNENEDKLYIPKINSIITIAPIGTDETSALEVGAVSRSNQNGNPKGGGNYVVVAKRFSLKPLPQDTFKRSHFYNLKNIQVGDDLFVDYKGTRFAYKVDSREMKESTDPSIEGTTEKAKLTLYTTELNADEKRDVFTAAQVGKVVWTSGAPRVEPVLD